MFIPQLPTFDMETLRGVVFPSTPPPLPPPPDVATDIHLCVGQTCLKLTTISPGLEIPSTTIPQYYHIYQPTLYGLAFLVLMLIMIAFRSQLGHLTPFFAHKIAILTQLFGNCFATSALTLISNVQYVLTSIVNTLHKDTAAVDNSFKTSFRDAVACFRNCFASIRGRPHSHEPLSSNQIQPLKNSSILSGNTDEGRLSSKDGASNPHTPEVSSILSDSTDEGKPHSKYDEEVLPELPPSPITVDEQYPEDCSTGSPVEDQYTPGIESVTETPPSPVAEKNTTVEVELPTSQGRFALLTDAMDGADSQFSRRIFSARRQHNCV